MLKAFVFGKFLPFHKGHEAMIRFALTKCDFLTVLICCSDKEGIPASTRQKWLKQTFEKEDNIEIRCLSYQESELPNTSESSMDVSRIWSKKFKQLFPDYALLVSSEAYGAYVASFMNIGYIDFDIERKLFPVSASAVRKDLFTNWHFLPESVKSDFAIKVVLLGTESTGKTSLTKRLSAYFACSCVMEAGRDLVADSKSFAFEDLSLVAAEHARRINQAVLGAHPLLIIDTDIHITMSYARFVFGRELEVEKAVYDSNSAELYLYLNNDVDFEQDGTRLSEVDRNLLDLSHREVLREHGIDIVDIKGDWEQRFEKAVEIIDYLIEGKSF